jgi:hypothetical protein
VRKSHAWVDFAELNRVALSPLLEKRRNLRKIVGNFLPESSDMADDFDQVARDASAPKHSVELILVDALIEIMLGCFYVFSDVVFKNRLKWVFKNVKTTV